MRRNKMGLLAVAALLPFLAAACGGGDDSNTSSTPSSGGSSGDAASTDSGSSSSAAAGSDNTLVVWADNSANTAKAIEPLCQAWAEANGVTCTVKKFNGGGPLDDALKKGNATGDVPDIYEGPHNEIGGMVDDGIIQPIDLGANADKFNPAAIDAITYDGNTYGVPWAVENVAMMTNKAMVPQCPATMDDAVATAKGMISAGKVDPGLGIAMQIGDTGDSYHWFSLYTADGGSAYKRNDDGTYDTSNLDFVTDPGSVDAGKRLQTLVSEGMMKGSVTFDVAREAFSKGRTPFFITGPWETSEQKAALGDNLMVCPVPPWKDATGKPVPFLGIRTFIEPAKAPHPALASTFLQDAVMTTDFMDGMYSVDPRPSAWTESFDKEASDPAVQAFGAYGADGVPMPNVPQQDNWFANMGLAEAKIVSGTDPAQALQQAKDSIAKQNAAG